MRTSLLAFLVIGMVLTTGFTCNDHDVPVHNLRGYFWTIDEAGITHRLYVDKQFKGILPHMASTSDTSLRNQKLNIPLEPGTHEVLVTDNNQTVISKGEIKLEFTSNNTNITSSWNNGRCMVEIVHD
jgi:hypothetical protein